MKRILTIQDISCVGKCSLTVALPIISAFGVEAAVLPTAVLSNHTAFKSFTFRDLTDDIPGIAEEWKKEGITFDAIYTGYLGSIRQIDLVSDIFRDFGTAENLIIADPAMADNGKLYKGFDQAFADKMATLCGKADIIVPNLTEAAFMLNEPYIAGDYGEDYIKETLKKLTGLGAKTAVLTGVSFEKSKLGAYGYDSVKNEFFSYFREYLPVAFHGTGDVFASALCGAAALGRNQKESAEVAVDFTVESIIKTMNNPAHNWYGVDFEAAFPFLMKKMGLV